MGEIGEGGRVEERREGKREGEDRREGRRRGREGEEMYTCTTLDGKDYLFKI